MAVVVAARWTARAGEEEAVAAAVAQLVAAIRANEPGCLLVQPHRDPDDPRVFFFYEQFVDRAALEAHADTEHFKRHGLGDALPRLESRERAFYVTWEP